jgi:hypothetical protein
VTLAAKDRRKLQQKDGRIHRDVSAPTLDCIGQDTDIYARYTEVTNIYIQQYKKKIVSY